jgi:hypothetical protein
MSSSTDNKTLIYNTLKTLNNPTEDSKTDFFNNDNEDFDVPESFSAFFGGVISEQDIQDAMNQLRQEKQKESERKGKDENSTTSSDEENDGMLNKVRKILKA